MNRTVYSVSRVNAYINQMFRADPVLLRVSVRGEVSNASYSSRGHIFFTLKDEESELTCVMFAGDRGGMSFRMKDGAGQCLRPERALSVIRKNNRTGRGGRIVCPLSGAEAGT